MVPGGDWNSNFKVKFPNFDVANHVDKMPKVNRHHPTPAADSALLWVYTYSCPRQILTSLPGG